MFDELLLCENIAGVFYFSLKNFKKIFLGEAPGNTGKSLVERSSQDFTISGTK